MEKPDDKDQSKTEPKQDEPKRGARKPPGQTFNAPAHERNK